MGFTGQPVHFCPELAQTLFDRVTKYAISFLLIVPAIYIINWVFYAIIIEISWVSEDPPEFLRILSVFLDIIYDPLPLHVREEQDPAGAFWLAPFSRWLTAVIAFMIWAVPVNILKVSPNAFHEEVRDEYLYVWFTLSV